MTLIFSPELQELTVVKSATLWINVLLEVVKVIVQGTINNDKATSLAKRCLALEFHWVYPQCYVNIYTEPHTHPPVQSIDLTTDLANIH